MNHLKRHLSVANVLSCVALFVALSGAAYAAGAIGNKSVKTRHLGNGSVTTRKLRNGAVTAAKIRNGAVIGTKIATGAVGATQLADGSVRSIALGGGVVTTSKLKDKAVTGEKLAGNSVSSSKLTAGAVITGHIQEGAVTRVKLAPNVLEPVVKYVSYVTGVSGLGPSPNLKTAAAECVPGATRKQVIGGGARILGANTKVALIESAPILDGAGNRVGWKVAANEFAEETEDWAVEAYAICAEF